MNTASMMLRQVREMQMTLATRLPMGLWQASSVGGCDSIDMVPLSRWDLEAGRTGSSQPRARFGGWLQAIDAFDSSGFGITAPEADLMDPQQRLLLEVCTSASPSDGTMHYFVWHQDQKAVSHSQRS